MVSIILRSVRCLNSYPRVKLAKRFCLVIAGGDKSNNARPQSKQLLPSKPLGGLSVKSQKKLSSKAQQVKVASQKGKSPISTRTDIAEAWVPLQGAGSDARLLVRLQGMCL